MWYGAAIAVVAFALALWLWSASDQFVSAAPGASLQLLGTSLLIAVGGGLVLALLCRFVVRRFAGRVSALYAGSLSGALILLLTLSPGASPLAWIVIAVAGAVAASVIGGFLGVLAGRSSPSPRARTLTIVAGVLSVAVTVWLLVPWGSAPAPLDDAGEASAQVDDLSAAGEYDVSTLSYGSGTDDRAAYGADVAFETPAVDFSTVITGWSDGAGQDRTDAWGFDATALPLNGMVWYPEGDGPFPVVLMVHGNKSTVASSEGGFGYLGEQLASNGMIAISIDENFLNTGLLDSAGGIGGADAARALVILEHLKMLADQGALDAGPLSGKLDLEHVALIGHSRGGEAVANAAMINGMNQLPDYPDFPVDYGFPITSVLALAPSAGQYAPDGNATVLTDVNYLVLHGSHDVDVSEFAGLDQYQRTEPGEGRLKAYLYIGGADHSQFNSSWGNRDIGNGLPKMFIDTGSLIDAQSQRAILRGYATAYLLTTLLGDDQSALLKDYRAGTSWLPETRYISGYASGDATTLVDGTDEDSSNITTEYDGGSVEHAPALLNFGPSDNDVSALTPDDGSSVTLDAEAAQPLSLAPGSDITIDVGVTGGDAAAPMTVVVTDSSGASAEVEVRPGAVPPIDAVPMKMGWMFSGAGLEQVLQTNLIPIDDLADDIDLASVTSIAVTVDAGDQQVLLDNLTVTEA